MASADGNLFANLPPGPLSNELIAEILMRPGVRIEHIVSTGQATPAGDWYDQDQDEWVLLVAGAARLELDPGGALDLRPGDHVMLPAHRRHRVAWTDPEQATVWVAVFVSP